MNLFGGFVGVFQVNTQIAMHTRVAVNPESKSRFGNLVPDGFPEFHDVFLKRFVTGRIVEDFSDDSGVSGPQDVGFGNPNEIADLKARHNRIVYRGER